MKKLLAIALAGSCAVTVFGQAQVVFSTKVSTANINAPITETVNQSTPTLVDGSDTLFRAALMGGATTATASTQDATSGAVTLGTLAMMASATTPSQTWVNFRTGVAAGYLAGGAYAVPGVAAGDQVLVQLVAWDGAYNDFASALAAGAPVGISNPLTITTSSSPDPTQVAYLVGLQGFNIGGATIPEPSTFALAGLGAAALLIFRRRK